MASGLRKLPPHPRSTVVFQNSIRTIEISYNPEFRGITGNQKPDIILRFQYKGWPDLIVVFDAKYRLDVTSKYIKQFGSPGPPIDAINVLHRYRDAIVIESAKYNRNRPVVKGVALFPLSSAESRSFASSKLYESLDILGIGALPYLPNNTKIVESWLKQLINQNPENLAEPGPPFAGLMEKIRRVAFRDRTSS